MDCFYRNGSKPSDFYYVYNDKNVLQYWSRITNKMVPQSHLPSNLLNLIEKQTIQDILLQALLQKPILEKQILNLKKQIVNLNNDMTHIQHPEDDLATPKYFSIINHAKKFITNLK